MDDRSPGRKLQYLEVDRNLHRPPFPATADGTCRDGVFSLGRFQLGSLVHLPFRHPFSLRRRLRLRASRSHHGIYSKLRRRRSGDIRRCVPGARRQTLWPAAFYTRSKALLLLCRKLVVAYRSKLSKLPAKEFVRQSEANAQTQLFMFGWTATPDVHWIFPSIAIALATMGIFFILLAIFNYLADNYGLYASSAIAAQSFCRNVMGGCFPLVTRQMYTRLGYGPASSLCGGIAVVLGLVPIVLIFYGDRVRERSKFAKSMAS